MKILSEIDHVYIHQDSLHSEVAHRVQGLFSKDKISVVNSRPLAHRDGELSAEEFSESKKLLYICEHKGHFFKRCPGARPGLTCCNYFVLNLGLQCNMNCSYCYLQSFINTPVMTVYSNIGKALEELREMGETGADQKFRIGTGETIDSLSLDEITLYSKKLIQFIKDYPNWQLEFKTKSALVDQFIDEEHAGNVIVSWSVNPENIIRSEEHGTASLEERLFAAQACRQRGFKVAFHIDPVIYHPQWKENYTLLIDAITQKFRPEDMPYISLGALRFQPEQKPMMAERFGMNSYVTQGEMFPSQDGKLRYDQNLRREMFDFIIQSFKSNNPKWNIFLCMETPETWLKTYESMPKSVDGLETLFDHRVVRNYRENNLPSSRAD